MGGIDKGGMGGTNIKIGVGLGGVDEGGVGGADNGDVGGTNKSGESGADIEC